MDGGLVWLLCFWLCSPHQLITGPQPDRLSSLLLLTPLAVLVITPKPSPDAKMSQCFFFPTAPTHVQATAQAAAMAASYFTDCGR